MSARKPKQKQIGSLRDFRQQFLSQPDYSSCPPGSLPPGDRERSFFEVSRLEELRPLQREQSPGSSRRSFYTIVLITSGKVQETIGFRNYEFGPGTLYFIPENHLHAIGHWSPDVRGFHCIFDADYFLLCLRNQVRLSAYPFFQPDGTPFIKLPAAEAERIAELFRTMRFEHCRRQTINDDLLVRMYLNILLLETERLYRHRQDIEETPLPRQQQLVAQFRKLVMQHCLYKRQVSDYAALLYVTPHYLNDTVKAVSGRAASAWIHDQLLAEAKSQLVQTDDTITQVATRLHFSDASYFCRFFRKQTGLSPAQFRLAYMNV